VLVAEARCEWRLVYASRLGGSCLDSSYGTGIAVDGEGHAYVTGVAITSDSDPSGRTDRGLPKSLTRLRATDSSPS